MAERKRLVARNRRRTITRLLLLLLLGVIVIGGIVAAVLLLTKKGSQQAQLTALPFSSQAEYSYTGSGFLYTTAEGIAYHDIADSNNDYTASVTTGEVKLVGSATAHVLYNAAALKIVGAPDSNSYAELLVDVACGSGHVAALWQDAAGKESIQVLNLTGEQKDLLVFEKQYVVDFGFNTTKNEYLWVQTLDIQSDTPICTIHIYNMTLGSTSGILQIQNQMVERVYFTNNSIFIVGTNQIIRYALENNRDTYRETVYGWKVLDYSNGSSFLLSPRSSGTLGLLKVMTLAEADVSSAKQTLIQAPAGAIGAFLLADKLAIVTEKNVYTYDLSGKRLSEYTWDITVSDAKKLDNSTLLIAQESGGLYLHKFR